MYTRKPKNLTKFLVNITSAQALHTWEYADKTRLGQMGSSALLSASARKKREANRTTIGEYRTSQIATQANKMRRDVTEFTQNERQKVKSRLERNQPPNPTKTPPAAGLNERPMPDASLYRRPSA